MRQCYAKMFFLGLTAITRAAFAQEESVAVSEEPATPAVLVRAKSCGPKQACPEFADVLRLIHHPTHGQEAVTLLGAIGDVRAVSPLAHLAAYGQEPELVRAAESSLQRIAETPAGQAAINGLAVHDPDPDVRAVAVRAGGTSEPAVEPQERRAIESGRVIYSETALGRRAGEGAWTVYNLGYHTLNYGITDNLEFVLGAVLPVGIYSVFPQLKATFHPTDNIHLGLTAGGGTAGVYVDGVNGVAFWGGGPILTLGDEKFLVNISVPVGGAVTYGEDVDHTVGWGLAPTVGVSYQISRRVRLNVENYSAVHKDMDFYLGAVIYGIRISGDNMFGDVSFLIPIYPGVEDILKYIPIGFPLLTFGVTW